MAQRFFSGIYKVKQLIKTDISIYLDGGTVLKGAGNRFDYAEYDPDKFKQIAHFIHIDHAENVTIGGRGTIDPSGLSVTGPVPDIRQSHLKLRGITTSLSNRIVIEGVRYLRQSRRLDL